MSEGEGSQDHAQLMPWIKRVYEAGAACKEPRVDGCVTCEAATGDTVDAENRNRKAQVPAALIRTLQCRLARQSAQNHGHTQTSPRQGSQPGPQQDPKAGIPTRWKRLQARQDICVAQDVYPLRRDGMGSHTLVQLLPTQD